jgi:hypothetical protein
MSKTKKTKKPVQKVTRAFLMNLADTIHDPKTKSFLRLCHGGLTNGPDPTNEKRRMHCGLGELFFALTNKHPEDEGATELDVINLAIERSTFVRDEGEKNARDAIYKLGLDDYTTEELLSTLDQCIVLAKNDADRCTGVHAFTGKNEQAFREILEDIPGKNDDGCPDYGCTIKTWRARSSRIATQLRRAAKLLPK